MDRELTFIKTAAVCGVTICTSATHRWHQAFRRSPERLTSNRRLVSIVISVRLVFIPRTLQKALRRRASGLECWPVLDRASGPSVDTAAKTRRRYLAESPEV